MPEDLTTLQAEHNMWKWKWRRSVAVAQGQYPATTVIRGGRVLNVFTEELIEADVALDGPFIIGVGSFPEGREEIQLDGEIIAPSFIDGHIHTESSLLWMPQFAEAVVPHGTGAIVTDPHEMANVAGLPGIEAMRTAAQGLPLTVAFTAPSCVPASEHESPGTTFGPDEIATMLAWPETIALGEVMNVPAVLAGSNEMGDILAAARNVPRDGHSPMLTGQALQAYVGSGIGSDHECTTADEAREKLRAGLMIMIREGSSEKNLDELLDVVTDATYPRMCFASDDRDCHDLLNVGHVDDILRRAIAGGIDPLRAVRMATWNAAQYWKLGKVGAIAPGYLANLVVLNDLNSVSVAMTMYEGQVVARDGVMVESAKPTEIPSFLTRSVSVAPIRRSQLALAAEDATVGIELVPQQIVTRRVDISPTIANGKAISDPTCDLLKAVSVERHHASGRVGVAMVRGFGFTRGAIASTIAHDAHNIVAVGVSDEDILAAIASVAESQGGLAVVADGEMLAHLPLPIAGLMSPMALADVAAAYDALQAAARSLGNVPDDPFGQLAFLSLSVIPEARVTDRGLLLVSH